MWPICRVVATTRHHGTETDCVRAYFDTVRGGQHRLQRRPALRRRPAHRQHPFRVVDGVDTLKGAAESMISDTRKFARRQRTWLRRVEGVLWMPPSEKEEIATKIEDFLADPDVGLA